MKNDSILRGYTNINRPYKVENYPYGFKLRTSIHYWIETKAKKGDRFGSYTINPTTGRPNAPKYSTYSPFLYLYLDDQTGYVQHGSIDSYHVDKFKLRFPFIIDRIGEEFISDEQKKNIRVTHYQNVRANAPYQVQRYSAERKPEFLTWLETTLNHIRTCEFKNLIEYPERPDETDPGS